MAGVLEDMTFVNSFNSTDGPRAKVKRFLWKRLLNLAIMLHVVL